MKTSTVPTHAETICTRGGQGVNDGDPLIAPIVQSTTFCREGIASAAEHAYSRVSNPTVCALEQALGQLEAASPGVAFSTGLAAEAALFLAVLRSGGHVICSRAVYGGTTRLIQQVLSDLGIAADFVDTTRSEVVARAIRPETRLVFVETPANPTLDISDIGSIAAITRDAGVLLAVDNTFLTVVLQQPLALGADISVYSTTKFIDGHSAALGGAIVSNNTELLERLRFIRKCTGAIQTPFNAWLTLQGLKTLPVRIRRQSQSAQTIATWLAEQPAVTNVCYPTLANSAESRLARRQHIGYHGAVVTFELDGGKEAAQRLLGATQLFRFAEHVGSVESLLTHPASMTHADVPIEQRRLVGATDGLIRLSIGLEHVDDLIADLRQAIDHVVSGSKHRRKEVEPCAAIA